MARIPALNRENIPANQVAAFDELVENGVGFRIRAPDQ